MVASIQDSLHHKFLSKWSTDVNRDFSQRGNDSNTLRTYKQFKQVYRTECYATMFLPFKHGSVFAEFRCGVAPLKLETGRYEGLLPEQRACFYCADCMESEEHVLLSYPVYDDLMLSSLYMLNMILLQTAINYVLF